MKNLNKPHKEIVFTEHALYRLNERFGFSIKWQIELISFFISLKKYRIFLFNNDRKTWILILKVMGRKIRVVYNPFNKTVVTLY